MNDKVSLRVYIHNFFFEEVYIHNFILYASIFVLANLFFLHENKLVGFEGINVYIYSILSYTPS